jgi:hypothetical protein
MSGGRSVPRQIEGQVTGVRRCSLSLALNGSETARGT